MYTYIFMFRLPFMSILYDPNCLGIRPKLEVGRDEWVNVSVANTDHTERLVGVITELCHGYDVFDNIAIY